MMKKIFALILACLTADVLMAQTTILSKTTILPKTTVIAAAPGLGCVQGGAGCTSATSTSNSQSSGAGGTLTLTLLSAVSSGDFVFVHLSYGFANYPTSPLFNGNAMTCLQYSTTADAYDSFCYIANVTTGGTVATFTCPSYCAGIIYEFSGVATSTPLDATSTTNSTGTTWTATTSTALAATGELGLGVNLCPSGPCVSSVNSPFLNTQCTSYTTGGGANGMVTCWVVLSSASAATFSGTSSQSVLGLAVAVFK
jgi:hypothetical protein